MKHVIISTLEFSKEKKYIHSFVDGQESLLMFILTLHSNKSDRLLIIQAIVTKNLQKNLDDPFFVKIFITVTVAAEL